jgi:epoxyqueuosine reductase QueG
VGMRREELFDAFACFKATRERQAQVGIDRTGCGLCIAVCPYTERCLKRALRRP